MKNRINPKGGTLNIKRTIKKMFCFREDNKIFFKESGAGRMQL